MSIVRKHRPYSVIRSSYRDLWEIRGADGHNLGSHWSTREIAQEFVDALNGYGPGPDEPLTAAQASAFLDALWPAGESAFVASHARTFFAALIGYVPRALEKPTRPLASILRRLADALEEQER